MIYRVMFCSLNLQSKVGVALAAELGNVCFLANCIINEEGIGAKNVLFN